MGLIKNVIFAAICCFAPYGYSQNSVSGGGTPLLGSQGDKNAQSAAISSYMTSNSGAFQGRATVVDQGGGAFTIQSGNGDTYFGVTSAGTTQIVGTKGPTMNCVSNAGSTNCIQY